MRIELPCPLAGFQMWVERKKGDKGIDRLEYGYSSKDVGIPFHHMVTVSFNGADSQRMNTPWLTDYKNTSGGRTLQYFATVEEADHEAQTQLANITSEAWKQNRSDEKKRTDIAQRTAQSDNDLDELWSSISEPDLGIPSK